MDTYNMFSAYPDLSIETMGILLQTFPAVDSKADTSSQSQMLSDHDSTKFIHAQHPKIDGLQRLGIFDVKHISEKPPWAHLLSSIWSYRHKRSPVGKILKHKAHLCVDGS
jgi:hypothetical protein